MTAEEMAEYMQAEDERLEAAKREQGVAEPLTIAGMTVLDHEGNEVRL